MSEQRLLVPAEMQKDIQSLFSDDYEEHRAGVESLAQFGSPAAEELIRLLKKNPLQKSREIIQALDTLGPAALGPLLQALQNSLEFKTLSDLFFVESLLEPMRYFPEKSQIPVLVSLLERLNQGLQDHPDSGLEEPVRRIKVKIHLLLAQMDSHAAFSDLQNLLGTGLQPVPLDLLGSVRKLGTKAMLPVLVRLYQQETRVSEWATREVKETFREICRRERVDQSSDAVFEMLSPPERDLLEKLLPKTWKKNGNGSAEASSASNE